MSDIELQSVAIPTYVVRELEILDHEVPEDVIDLDTIMTFLHLFGYDDGCRWLASHRPLYFEALRRCRCVDYR